jgi:hypothetical protein
VPSCKRMRYAAENEREKNMQSQHRMLSKVIAAVGFCWPPSVSPSSPGCCSRAAWDMSGM